MEKSLLVKAKRHLCATDSIMAQLIKTHKPFSLEEGSTVKRLNHYHTLVRTIVSQQLSVKAAQTIQDRLQTKQGGKTFLAIKMNRLSDDEIRQCGVSKNKVRYIRALTLAILSKELNFKKLEKLENNLIIESLTKYPGIGPWSAEMFLMISFKRLDVLPLGDLIIRKSMQNHYGIKKDASYDHYFKVAEPWQPYRSIASRYLWASASSK